MASRNMGRNASSVGMMEGAFFVGRVQLLEWVNKLLAVNLTKVEQCASGAIYCQVVDACYPGTVRMAKVNWMAKADHEYIPNYKVLQAAFDRHNIEKHVYVDSLIRAKYQDNLEFLQWMKALWDREGAGRQDSYDAVQGRQGKPVPAWAKAAGAPIARGTIRTEKENQANIPANRDQIGADKKHGYAPERRAVPKAATQKAPTPRSAAKPGAATAVEQELKQQVAEQSEEITELQEALEGLERERDYYFKKLRDIEIMCNGLQDKAETAPDVPGVVQRIQEILFAEDDDPGEEENLDPAVGLPLEPAEAPPAEMFNEVPELPSFGADQCVATAA
jgi:RP/EB family microtubule-associated protein